MSAYLETLRRRGCGSTVTAVEYPPARAHLRVQRLTPRRILTEYGALREQLLVAANGEPVRVAVFAGCNGGEGCTHIVREFAETLASSGLKVLLVDADFRSAGLTASFNATGPDLCELVRAGTVPPDTSWGKGQLTVIPSPPSAPEKEYFFRAPEFATWIDEQRARYDYLLLDAPPLLRFAEAMLMGKLSDGVVVVVQAEVTEREALVRAREQLERTGANVIGVVLNRVHDPVPAFLRPYLSIQVGTAGIAHSS